MEWTSRDGRHRLLCGDVRELLRTLPAESVHCCVTSPPYWGLRDYGTAKWEGGDAACDHQAEKSIRKEFHQTRATGRGSSTTTIHASVIPQGDCIKCGARRIDRQIGQEPTPEEYVATMVDVFREVRRVLHDSGTVWLNLGTCYASSGGERTYGSSDNGTGRGPATEDRISPSNYKPKDLILIPFLVAEALRQDGWWLRSVICWAKKSPMPESVTDRPTNSWEPIFLLAKRARYFYDAEAVKEKGSGRIPGNLVPQKGSHDKAMSGSGTGLFSAQQREQATRNQRNVWHLGPEPFPDAHFATFPSEIPRRAILAGTSHEGCCPQCGEPWRRVVEKTDEPDSTAKGSYFDRGKTAARDGGDRTQPGERYTTRTLGFEPACTCPAAPPVPCTVLDTFAGSGTVGMVAAQLARRSIGIELNPTYWQMARDRIAQETQQPLLF